MRPFTAYLLPALVATCVALAAGPVAAAADTWYYVNMGEVPADQQCVALPEGTSPARSLADNAASPAKHVSSEEWNGGRLQTFVSESGTRYAFTDTRAGCVAFRERVVTAMNQGRLADKAGWLVADGERNQCRPLAVLFPAVGDFGAAQIPAQAQELARHAGLQPEMKFMSPTIASLTLTYPAKGARTFTLFAKKSECGVYLSGLREAMQQLRATSRPAQGATQRAAFGTYSGAAGGLTLAVETKAGGTGFLIVNQRSGEFTFEPTGIVLHTADGKYSPCTAHLLSLQGIGVPTTVAVKAGATEGYLLGACPQDNNLGKMGSRFVITQPIKKVVVGGVEFRMRLDP